MVRAGLLVGILVAVAAVAPLAGADTERAPEALAPEDAARFADYPRPPDAIRLWAQVASTGDAYLTLGQAILTSPYTPVPGPDADPAAAFEVFAYVATAGSDDEGTQYHARATPALWDVGFMPDHDVVAQWLLSASADAAESDAALPPILVSTTLKAVDGDGFERLLSWRTVRADVPRSTEPAPLRVVLPPPADGVRAGERLVLDLDWTWTNMAPYGITRPPLVTLHPGSFVDLPLAEPVKILGIAERNVLDDVYVQAEVAHVFALENLDIGALHLVMAGPGVNTQGGRPFVASVEEGVASGHALNLDWRVPLQTAGMAAGDYALFVAAGQVGEEGPRAIAKRTLHVEGQDPATFDEAAADLPGAIAAFAFVAGAAALGYVRRGRPGPAGPPRR